MIFIEFIFDDLVYQTNVYGTQQNRIQWIEREYIIVFIGIHFCFGYYSVLSYKDYWSISSDLYVKFANAMFRNTFEKFLLTCTATTIQYNHKITKTNYWNQDQVR